MQASNELTLEEAFKRFINAKKITNKAEETIKYYEIRFEYLQEYIESQEPDIKYPSQILSSTIDNYILWKKDNNPDISPNTINNHLRAFRAILYYFMEEGYMKGFTISLLTVKKNPKEAYSTEEQGLLLEKPNMKNCSFTEYRNWVIICHFLATGNRSKTVRSIKVKHVNLSNRMILLSETKNHDVYEIPISNEYYPILAEYMQIRNGQPEDFLFCSQYGNQLTDGGLRCIMRKYNLKHGVQKTSLHKFRNTFARHWIMEDGSTKKLQYALGHNDPKMVDEYVKLYGRDLKKDFDQYTPLSGFKDKINRRKIDM